MHYSLKSKQAISFSLLDPYRQATVVSLLLSTFLLGCFLVCGNMGELIFSEWPVSCTSIFGFNGHLLSSSTYIGRAVGLTHKPIKKSSWKELIELGLTLFGILLGLAFGIVLCVVKHTAVTCIGIINAMIFTMRAIGSFAGMGNRLGSLGRRPAFERAALILATVIGLAIGTALFCTSSIPCICVAGVNMFFAGSSMLPTALSFIIAVGYITSCYESAADYASKAWRFYNAVAYRTLHEDDLDNTHIRERVLEYFGSFIMGAVGLVVSMLIIPHIFVGFASLGAIATVMISCVSIFGGIGSRIGGWGDAHYQFECIKDVPENNTSSRSTPTSFTLSSSRITVELSSGSRLSATSPKSLSPSNTSSSLIHAKSCPNFTLLHREKTSIAAFLSIQKRNVTAHPVIASGSEATQAFQRCF